MKEISSDVDERSVDTSVAAWKLHRSAARNLRNVLVRSDLHHVKYCATRHQQTQRRVCHCRRVLLSTFIFQKIIIIITMIVYSPLGVKQPL